MRSFSNTYIFVFSLIMVTIVAVLLSFVSTQLKPRQEMNVQIEKKQDVLRSVGRAEDAAEADDKNAYINEEFGKYITESYVVDFNGNRVEADAFEIMLGLTAEIRKAREERNYPVFVYSENGGPKKYVVPVRGKGLWGPIWGYIALEEDLNTISGAVFDHKAETPGLGSDINTGWFQEPFTGKTIFNEQGEFVSVEVVKGGADPSNIHQVDAISGGTITSKALEEMIMDCMTGYVAHFKELANN
ncbi:MAG: NADH:ubiquinone reductase (Na(+)-transporting) subunit C [Bacteroidales bacterium]|nr:NADH:ubiquinone reductase (Na(+)-transporting) subunit C [Bacteroidales bacterium]